MLKVNVERKAMVLKTPSMYDHRQVTWFARL
jgi:hypothetical protein